MKMPAMSDRIDFGPVYWNREVKRTLMKDLEHMKV